MSADVSIRVRTTVTDADSGRLLLPVVEADLGDGQVDAVTLLDGPDLVAGVNAFVVIEWET